MAIGDDAELIDRFEEFYRDYYRNEIGELAQKYPNEQRSLYLDWNDLYRYDPDIADDFVAKPGQMREYAEEALRLYDLPVDVKLGGAHVRVENLSDHTGIRDIRADHVGNLVAVQGIVRKATDVRPKMQEAAFECQRCGTLTRIPQGGGEFQEPHQCQGCERQGPFKINFDQSEFVDAQKLRVQESPEGLRGGETPQAIDINIEDDITGRVTAGDHVTATGILHLEQQGSQQEKSAIFDFYMEGLSVKVEDEQFEEMDISDEDEKRIVALSDDPEIYDKMVKSMAPSIFGYHTEKLAIIMQLFSGVRKSLPDGSRIRGDIHILMIGDPGTGKCLSPDAIVTLSDGSEVPIRDLVESNLNDPKPIDDGVWDEVDFEVPSMADDGSLTTARATKVWKREAPDRMYRVRTESGREVEVTPSHPLFTVRDGRTEAVVAEELTEGESIAVPQTLQTEGDDSLDVSVRRSRSKNAVRMDVPDRLTPSLGRLLGYIVAEGYVQQRDSGSGAVYVTNNDREILDDVADGLERLGLNYSERQPHDGRSAREVICSSSEFVSFLEALEPAMLERSGDQRVPGPILRATRPVKRGFLRALVDSEGTVSPKQREISVSSTSRELLEGVRSLLLAFGIDSQLKPKTGGSYRLRISGEDFARYIEMVGFVTERKQAAAAAQAHDRGNTNRDVVPGVGDVLRDTREELGLTQAECGLPRSTYQHYERGDRNPSRESLRTVLDTFEDETGALATDGGVGVESTLDSLRGLIHDDIAWDRIESIETVDPDYEWVYDLEVEGTHNYLSNNVVSHNSQILQYVKKLAPRSVYTSGKGSSSAGLTAAAVRDDFGEGQQWTLEAGALVLADQGVAAVDELDKMRSEDQSAMHQALEQQEISISKAGINATLKSRCSLLGAANPTYGRFDEYEPVGEQIDLEPPLISRFDLIFTVTDKPDKEKDQALAEHIIKTNYAGELNTHRVSVSTSNVSQQEVDNVTEEVVPEIEPELLRKYVAYAKRNCYPTMTEEAKEAIRDFYVDMRTQGSDDSAVPVTARKLEALVRLAEASARIRLSDRVTTEDTDRVIAIVQSSLEDVGMDPETGELDADMVEAGTSKSQRDRIKNVKGIIRELQEEYDDGAPYDQVLERAEAGGIERSKAEHEIQKLKDRGDIYEPKTDHLRVV
jgi:replicative DNA helicase Mcm